MFNFKLQTILNVRKTIEEAALYEFSEQQKALNREMEQLQSIERQKAALLEELRNIQGKVVNVSEIEMKNADSKHCRKREAAQKMRVEEATIKVDGQRQVLLDAAKNRKAMEILKTKQQAKYLSDIDLIERTASDEMTIVRHKRRK
jgi:flagellar protein FliJ